MAFGPHAILAPQPIITTVNLEPVYNILGSMAILTGEIESQQPKDGIDDWILETAAQLTPDVQHTHQIIFWGVGLEGLTNAVERGPATTSFETYLTALTATDDIHLRDSALFWFVHSTHRRVFAEMPPPSSADLGTLLADQNQYLDFVLSQSQKKLPRQLYIETHALLNDPARFKATLVSHLSALWETYFKAEWQRVQPMLQQSIDAFQQVDTAGLTVFEVIQVITGRNLRSLFRAEELYAYRHIQFIPSKHNGPYLVWFGDDTTLRILFGARTPTSTGTGDKPLHQNELINRLKALADENRLQILLAISTHGELSTQDIMAMFNLNKSAVSRYLGQLYANNFIHERRDTDGKSKFYSLNPTALHETTQTLQALLGD